MSSIWIVRNYENCSGCRRCELATGPTGIIYGGNTTTKFSLQHNQLLPELSIFRFKSALGLEERSHQVEVQGNPGDHVAVAEPGATPHLSLQHDQLLPERGIFGFKSDLGLDECRQQVGGQKISVIITPSVT